MGLRGSRIFNGGQLTIGMDPGDRSSCYCVLDEPGAAPRASVQQKVPGFPRSNWTQRRQNSRVANDRTKFNQHKDVYREQSANPEALLQVCAYRALGSWTQYPSTALRDGFCFCQIISESAASFG